MHLTKNHLLRYKSNASHHASSIIHVFSIVLRGNASPQLLRLFRYVLMHLTMHQLLYLVLCYEFTHLLNYITFISLRVNASHRASLCRRDRSILPHTVCRWHRPLARRRSSRHTCYWCVDHRNCTSCQAGNGSLEIKFNRTQVTHVK